MNFGGGGGNTSHTIPAPFYPTLYATAYNNTYIFGLLDGPPLSRIHPVCDVFHNHLAKYAWKHRGPPVMPRVV